MIVHCVIILPPRPGVSFLPLSPPFLMGEAADSYEPAARWPQRRKSILANRSLKLETVLTTEIVANFGAGDAQTVRTSRSSRTQAKRTALCLDELATAETEDRAESKGD